MAAPGDGPRDRRHGMEVEAASADMESAWALDANGSNTMEVAYAGAAADLAMKVATQAVQVFGGYGYASESIRSKKLMRDAKIFQIYEGTSQIQREIMVRGDFPQAEVGMDSLQAKALWTTGEPFFDRGSAEAAASIPGEYDFSTLLSLAKIETG